MIQFIVIGLTWINLAQVTYFVPVKDDKCVVFFASGGRDISANRETIDDANCGTMIQAVLTYNRK